MTLCVADRRSGRRRGTGTMRIGDVHGQERPDIKHLGHRFRQRRCIKHRPERRWANGNAAATAGEAGVETVLSVTGRRRMAGRRGMSDNAGADLKCDDTTRPSNRNAKSKQKRLQHDRIGRCQRQSGARMVPQFHGWNLMHFPTRGNGEEPLVPSGIIRAECMDSTLRDWATAEYSHGYAAGTQSK